MKNLKIYITGFVLIFFLNTSHIQAYKPISDIIVNNDIEYLKYKKENGEIESLKLDIYQPNLKGKKKRPVILLVHGGGFAQGDKQQELYKKMASTFASQGFIALSVNYTLKELNAPYCPEVLKRDVAQVREVVKWLGSHKRKYRADMSKVLICGDSAGGGIVVNASLNCSNSFRFAGCIDLWGGLPGEKKWDTPIFPYELSNCVPPICIIHGTSDSVVPYKTSNNLADQFKEANKYFELHQLQDADHYPEELAGEFIQIMLEFAQKITTKK